MPSTLTNKWQVTIPKQIRDLLGLKPGTQFDFAVNQNGEIVLRKAKRFPDCKDNRFEAARGRADVKWRTQDLMALLRCESQS